MEFDRPASLPPPPSKTIIELIEFIVICYHADKHKQKQTRKSHNDNYIKTDNP